MSNDLSLRDGEVNSVRSHIDFGAGIRVLKGDRTGYAFSESTRFEDLMKAAATAAEIAGGTAAEVTMPENCTPVSYTDRYPVVSGWEEHSIVEKKHYLLMLRDFINRGSDRIVSITGNLGDMLTRVLFSTPSGNVSRTRAPWPGCPPPS